MHPPSHISNWILRNSAIPRYGHMDSSYDDQKLTGRGGGELSEHFDFLRPRPPPHESLLLD